MGFRSFVKLFIPKQLFKKIEPYGHLGEAVALNTLHRYPAKDLKVIGVTGTNGKTTTSFLIHRMLYEAGYKVGLMTTVAYGAGDNIKPQMQHMTNVTIPVLMRRLKELKKEGIEWLVLETTSQGLAQNRVWGVPYSIAVLTNITHEHLDYHGTFKRYVAAKRKLFSIADQNKGGLRLGIVNADDPVAPQFTAAIQNAVTYGVKQGDLKAFEIHLKPGGVQYRATIDDRSYTITCHIPGSFNVYNSLAAVAVGHKIGLSKDQIEQGIAALGGVEGRMTRIDEGQRFTVIVDFAHTPDSFEKLFVDIRPVVKGKLIVLFGSAGRRDEAKRGIQGKLAGEYADELVLTEEDNRDIDGQKILNQISKGAASVGKKRDKNMFLIPDRTEAINFAVSRAQGPDDMVLLLGKGHEKTIERADGEHPWDEIKTAHIALQIALQKD